MESYWRIPELSALRLANNIIRIPPGVDVPITDRVRSLVDSEPFQRLGKLSQLGLVSMVYPGARHTRFEHSLGVFRNALLFLERLLPNEQFRSRCSPYDCTVFLCAALLHDVGHYPYAHPIEDMKLVGGERHEFLAQRCLLAPEIDTILRREFDVNPHDVVQMLAPENKPGKYPLLFSMLSGPIDIDKLDYLARDSLHAGVPYGRNFDQERLIHQLCVDEDRNTLALTHKAKTAAEMMVFARYVMFSEVYWHHAVRAATAMLQRCVYEQPDSANFVGNLQAKSDEAANEAILKACADDCEKPFVADIASCLFGPKRRLYKRLAEYDVLEQSQIHTAIARRPYAELVDLSNRLAQELGLSNGQVLIDAPPAKLEVQFDVRLRLRDHSFASLGQLSPVVKTLATQQFDNMVKRVRVFVHPDLRGQIDSDELSSQLAKLVAV